MKTKEKTIFLHSPFGDRTICICAKIITQEFNNKLYREVRFGHSIKNPNDEPNTQLAERIAKGRTVKASLGVIKTNTPMLLNIGIIDMYMNRLTSDIINNPTKYIVGYKELIKS
jgi:hypothetical protein